MTEKKDERDVYGEGSRERVPFPDEQHLATRREVFEAFPLRIIRRAVKTKLGFVSPIFEIVRGDPSAGRCRCGETYRTLTVRASGIKFSFIWCSHCGRLELK